MPYMPTNPMTDILLKICQRIDDKQTTSKHARRKQQTTHAYLILNVYKPTSHTNFTYRLVYTDFTYRLHVPTARTDFSNRLHVPTSRTDYRSICFQVLISHPSSLPTNSKHARKRQIRRRAECLGGVVKGFTSEKNENFRPKTTLTHSRAVPCLES